MNIKKLTTTNLKDKKAISLTAYRALFIAKLLISTPKSTEEILKAFSKDKFLSKFCHKDTLTNSINSLRKVGFVIDKPKPSNNFKFVLKQTPFKLKISQDQAELLNIMRESLFYSNNYKLLFKINSTYQKITDLTYCPQNPEILEHSNHLKTIDPTLLNDILEICKDKATAKIIYKSPINGNEELIIKAEKVVFENKKLYLWLYSFKYKTPAYFRIDKISSIQRYSQKEKEEYNLSTTVKYQLKGNAAQTFIPLENEIIIEKLIDTITIKAEVINTFNFFQRIIAFTDECTILEPQDLKDEYLNFVDSILGEYDNAEE